MKSLLTLSIVFLCYLTQGLKNDYIRIEYVGSADKPMPVIFISKKPIPNSEQVITIEYDFMTYNYIVNNNEFMFIENTVDSTSHKMFQKKDYNGFKITVRKNNISDAYFITRKNSNSLFLKANACLSILKRKNEKLIHAITLQRTRNVF
jgi:hypothetical protein